MTSRKEGDSGKWCGRLAFRSVRIHVCYGTVQYAFVPSICSTICNFCTTGAVTGIGTGIGEGKKVKRERLNVTTSLYIITSIPVPFRNLGR